MTHSVTIPINNALLAPPFFHLPAVEGGAMVLTENRQRHCDITTMHLIIISMLAR